MDEPEDILQRIPSPLSTLFTSVYMPCRPALQLLYEKGKKAQWDAADIDWSIEVDQARAVRRSPPLFRPLPGLCEPFASWDREQWLALNIEVQNWQLSQFLHGEQGALLCAARLLSVSPWMEAKSYAATQVMDEARHVEVFHRYVSEKLSRTYPLNPHLRALLVDTLGDARWDLLYLGMQIIIEGLALAAFGAMRATTMEPLLKSLLSRIMADEARHMAFGITSLTEVYGELSDAELRERADFAYEACILMKNNFMQPEVWAVLGVSREQAAVLSQASPQWQAFLCMLFSKVFRHLRKLGLVDAGAGYLRRRLLEGELRSFVKGMDED